MPRYRSLCPFLSLDLHEKSHQSCASKGCICLLPCSWNCVTRAGFLSAADNRWQIPEPRGSVSTLPSYGYTGPHTAGYMRVTRSCYSWDLQSLLFPDLDIRVSGLWTESENVSYIVLGK